jgi:class 3 adenylate cyclase
VAFREKFYRWAWDFRAPPAALWPLVSNTDRFNRDCGFPPFHVRPDAPGEAPAEPGVRRLRSVYLGIAGEWEEREFEWIQPVRFAVHRTFSRGPLSRMVQSCELAAGPGGGTSLVYEMRVSPRNLLGAAIIPLSIGLRMHRSAERVLRRYDEIALLGPAVSEQPRAASAAEDTGRRLRAISLALVSQARQPPPLVGRLCAYVSSADDLSASKMRPYALADAWGASRRETLDLFLNATRAGMLDLSWEVLCPHCRGSKKASGELSAISSEAHCDSCGIDFTVNFDQSVELTFVPNPTVRRVERLEYCMGGPQITPHIVAQKRLGPGESLYVAMSFPEGRYRVRTQGLEIQHAFRIERGAATSARIVVGPGPAPADEPILPMDAVLTIENAGSTERLSVIERVAWSDQSVTAAAVTSRQIFRDLFSREILRPGERISVGAITIVFTDLKNSTRLYRDIGDAPAFGRVLNHFDTLKAVISEGDGAIVKTMGDAVMATFTDPAAAVRAMRRAQAELSAAGTPHLALSLKCSIHQGPCLAISQNERLDYFGTTVNVCARLCSQSTGADIVVSGQVLRDPEVAAMLAESGGSLAARADCAPLRGMGDAPYDFWRVSGPLF